MKTIQEVSKETLKIENYLKDQPEGKVILYKEIAENCNIEMDERGKSFMRTALKRCKLNYLCIRGEGIELASPETVMSIASDRVIKIDNTIKKSSKITKNLYNRFSDRMVDIEAKQLDYLNSFFNAVKTSSNNAKRMLKSKVEFANYKKIDI